MSRKYRIVVVVVAIVLWVFLWPRIFSNANILKYSLLTGRAVVTKPLPLYGYLRNDNPLFKEHTFAADFAVVYFRAKNLDKKDVYSGQYDPWARPAPYTPVMLFIYSKTFCHLPFAVAALAHLAFQMVLLLVATFLIFQYYKSAFLIVPVSLIYAVLLFLSPVGLSWFERGQFDIFAGLSLLFLMFGIYESKGYAFALAAFFAMLKLSMALFLIQAFILYLLIYPDKARWKFFGIFSGVIFLMAMVFPQHMAGFWDTLRQIQNSAEGITIVNKVPHIVCLFIPVVCVLLFLVPAFFSSRKEAMFRDIFLPYMTGLVGINLLLMESSWEYRIVCCLGLLPMMIIWCLRLCADRSYCDKIMLFFILFLVAAFHLYWVINPVPPAEGYVIATYIAFYSAVVAVSLPRIFSMRHFHGSGII